MNYSKQFDNLVKFGVKFNIVDGKKIFEKPFPKGWQNLTSSNYNNEPNFAILTGEINNIIVIDLDWHDKSEGFEALSWFEDNFGKINEINTLITKTISDGYHVYFKYDTRISNGKYKNIDILSNGKCCFEGKGYEVVNDSNIRELTNDELNIILSLSNKNTNKEIIAKQDNDNEIEDYKFVPKTEIETILDNLSIIRSDNRDYWMRIGFFLANYDFGEELFKEFSMKSKNYNPDRHDTDWNSFKKNNNSSTHGGSASMPSLDGFAIKGIKIGSLLI